MNVLDTFQYFFTLRERVINFWKPGRPQHNESWWNLACLLLAQRKTLCRLMTSQRDKRIFCVTPYWTTSAFDQPLTDQDYPRYRPCSAPHWDIQSCCPMPNFSLFTLIIITQKRCRWANVKTVGHNCLFHDNREGLIFMTFATSENSSDFPCLCFAKWFKSKSPCIKTFLHTFPSCWKMRNPWLTEVSCEGSFTLNSLSGSARVPNRDQWNHIPCAEPGGPTCQ